MELNRVITLKNRDDLFLSRWLRLGRRMSLMLSSLFLVTLAVYSDNGFAHASLVKAEPARRAILSVYPKQIRLWFNEEIEADYASLIVFNEEKKAVTEKKPLVHPDDPKSIFLELTELPPGKYTVKFRVLSVDGHVVDADYNFTIKKINQ